MGGGGCIPHSSGQCERVITNRQAKSGSLIILLRVARPFPLGIHDYITACHCRFAFHSNRPDASDAAGDLPQFALAQVPGAFFVPAPRPQNLAPATPVSRSTLVPGAALSAREGCRHVRNRRLLKTRTINEAQTQGYTRLRLTCSSCDTCSVTNRVHPR